MNKLDSIRIIGIYMKGLTSEIGGRMMGVCLPTDSFVVIRRPSAIRKLFSPKTGQSGNGKLVSPSRPGTTRLVASWTAERRPANLAAFIDEI